MKKIVVIVLVIAMVMGLGILSAFATDPPTYNGSVTGIITSDDAGVITGTVSGSGYNLAITGQFTSEFVDQHATFNASVSPVIPGEDFSGTIIDGLYCNNGMDTIYGVITGTGAADPVRFIGVFLKTGIEGDFSGAIITGAIPTPVTSLSITTAGDAIEVEAGSTLQCTADMTPAGYDVAWSVWTSKSSEGRASIDQNGLLTGLQAGNVTVIANTIDSSLATMTKTITVVDPVVEISASIDPSYIIVIPAAVDFGTMVKDSGTIGHEFVVEAKSVALEDGYHIRVGVTSDFVMKDKDGTGDISLPYLLENSVPIQMTSGATFSTFTGDRNETGKISVNTNNIEKAGSYKGNMVFTIAYEEV